MKLFLMAAASRKDSMNKKLIRIANEIAQEFGETDLAQSEEFPIPMYDGDLETNKGVPEGAKKFVERFSACDGIIISSPEYNFSMPGTLKNLIDWVSRIDPNPLAEKQINLMSASPSMVGGNRGLWSVRVPLECLGANVFSQMFSLASAFDAFDEGNQLKDGGLRDRLKSTIEGFVKEVSLHS